MFCVCVCDSLMTCIDNVETCNFLCLDMAALYVCVYVYCVDSVCVCVHGLLAVSLALCLCVLYVCIVLSVSLTLCVSICV